MSIVPKPMNAESSFTTRYELRGAPWPQKRALDCFVLRRFGRRGHSNFAQSVSLIQIFIVIVVCGVFTLSAAELTDPSSTDNLGQFAKAHFSGILSLAEVELFRAASLGTVADCTLGSRADDPVDGACWDSNRVIRASRLIWLCTDRVASQRVHFHGIRIRGARIEEDLDLASAIVRFPLEMVSCYFGGPIVLTSSHLRNLVLTGSVFTRLQADEAVVKGFVSLDNCNPASKRNASNAVSFEDARVASDFVCTGGHFVAGIEENALSFNGAEIRGTVHLDRGFKAHGKVNFVMARIHGDVQCDDGSFTCEGRNCAALDLNSSTVDGSVQLGNAFTRRGMNLVGNVDCAHSRVNGLFGWFHVVMPNGCRLDLRHAKVGRLYVDRKADAWPAELLINEFVYDGIDDIVAGDIPAGNPMRATEQLKWLRRQRPETSSTQSYEHLAKILRSRGLSDDAREIIMARDWDEESYQISEKIHKHQYAAAVCRIIWLGLSTGAAKLFGYFYNTTHMFVSAIVIIIIGFFLYGTGYRLKLVNPTRGDAYVNRSEESVPQWYPKFNAFVYSVETFVPLVRLGLEGHWAPNAKRDAKLTDWREPFDPLLFGFRKVCVIGQWVGDSMWTCVLALFHILRGRGKEFRKRRFEPLTTGSALRIYLWIHIFSGWILTTLWVARITGLLQP